MKAVFTIVAKNYFSFAKTFAKSIKALEPELDVYIGVADEIEDLHSFIGIEYNVILAKDIGIDGYEEMCFKYNVTEFCTAVKPFYFDYFFTSKQYKNVIFFDPDILMYDSPKRIFESLEKYSFVLTPHYVTPEIIFTGNASETLTLFAGIYNLGFIAIKNSLNGNAMISWWKQRLKKTCFTDKFEALMVDQKWIDFLPAYYPSDVLIDQNLGYNIAYWNIHERKLIGNEKGFFVENRVVNSDQVPITFIHFSGLNPKDIYSNKQCPGLDLIRYQDWIPFLQQYVNMVLANDFDNYLKYDYSYGAFADGYVISHFQRRLYRRLVDENLKISEPFSNNGKFYNLLKSNKMLLSNNSNPDKLNERNFANFDQRIKKINSFMKVIKWFLGFRNYSILLKFCQRYFRPENQTFLLGIPLKFINENVK